MLTLNFLDKKTKKELQKALKTEEHAVTRERILILLLRNEGKKYDEISELLVRTRSGTGRNKETYRHL